MSAGEYLGISNFSHDLTSVTSAFYAQPHLSHVESRIPIAIAIDDAKSRPEPNEKSVTPHLTALDEARTKVAEKTERLLTTLEKHPSVGQDKRIARIVDKLSNLAPEDDSADKQAVPDTAIQGSDDKALVLDAEVHGLIQKKKKLEEVMKERTAQLEEWKEKANRANELEQKLNSIERGQDVRILEWKNKAGAQSDRVNQLAFELEEERKAWAGFSIGHLRNHILSKTANKADDSRPSTNPVPSQFLVDEAFHSEDLLFPVRLDELAMYKVVLEILIHLIDISFFPRLPMRYEGDLWKIWMALERLDDDEIRGRVAAPMISMVRRVKSADRNHGIDATTLWITSQIVHYFRRYDYRPAWLTGELYSFPSAMRDWAEMILERGPDQITKPVEDDLRILQIRYPEDVSRWECHLKGEPRTLVVIGRQGSGLNEQIMLITIRNDGKWSSWSGQRGACALFQFSLNLLLMAEKHGDAASAMVLRFDEDYWEPHQHHLRQLFPRERQIRDANMQSLASTRDWW